MLLLERVREIGVEDAHVGDETVRIARQALMREVARSARPDAVRRSRRLTWTGVGLGSLVAGAAVTAIVAGSVLSPAEAPSAAAAIFEDAAAGADSTGNTPLDADQYRRFETESSWLALWDTDMPDGAHFNNGFPQDAEAALLVKDTMTTYVPATPDDDWVRERNPYAIASTFGDRAAEATAEWEASHAGNALEGVTRYPGGKAEAGGDGGTFEYYLDSRDEYADLPADVRGVIDWFAARYEGEGDTNGLAHYFVETLSDVNVFNLAPASARANMFRAFATLSDVAVVASDGDTSTLRYERTNSEGEVAPIEFTLDTATGYVLGVTAWPYGYDSGSSSVGPDGAPGWSSQTVVTMSIVDAAP